MDGCEQLGVDRVARESRLDRRGRTGRLPRGDPDDQDRQIARQDGEFGITIETGKTQIQRKTRKNTR